MEDKVERLGPESGSNEVSNGAIRPQHRKLHDPNVSFEEYVYYAQRTRAEEDARDEKLPKRSLIQTVFRQKTLSDTSPSESHEEPAGAIQTRNTSVSGNLANRADRMTISDEEWTNASRALRTATWGACFYLITTDILGPYGVGFAMGTLGWGPGIALYTVFGFFAGWSGFLLYKVFLGLDSHEFPLRNYGDLAFRIYGTIPRHVTNILQVIQLLAILGQVIIQNGQSLSQVAKFKLCYAVCCVIFVIFGFAIGQVRTLKSYGWLASIAVWLNILTIFITMGVMAHSPPNYSIATLGSAGATVDPASIEPDPKTGEYPPVIHYNGLPDPDDFVGALNGLMQGVFAYGGAFIFVEVMAELRRPRDFIKAMWAAQFFIYSVYLIYGCYVYYWQGQYSYDISYQGVSLYGWQVVGDMITILSGLIAAGLYGNIGIKVLYNNVLIDLFSAPLLTTKSGKILFAAIVPVWWAIAFLIAAGIPDYFAYVAVVAAVCIIQFSYSFPPILAIGYYIQRRAMLAGDGFDPSTGLVVRQDSGIRRLVRGFLAGPWYYNVAHIIHAGG